MDIVGKTFGQLTVLERAPCKFDKNGKKVPMWLCICSCGNKVIARQDCLLHGRKFSCGCNKGDRGKNFLKYLPEICRDKNGKITRLYRIYTKMKSRCYNPNENNYKWYGAKGIKVCEEWKTNYENFYNWAISSGYNDSLTIDRIDISKDYCPENCRWILQSEQSHNLSSNKIIEYDGKSLCYAQWEKLLGFCAGTISRRIKKGWTEIEAITTPIKNKKGELIMTNDSKLQAPYVGSSKGYDDRYVIAPDEDDRDVDFEYESWRDMQDEEKYSQEDK